MSKNQNVVYVGTKHPIDYVNAIITNFTRFDTSNVILKARGRAIKTAIDATEIARRNYINELVINKIKIGTEQIQKREGGKKNISTMDITLTRKKIKNEKSIKTKQEAIKDLELTKIEGIGPKRLEKLKNQGIVSIKKLAKSNTKELSKALEISEKRIRGWVYDAKKILLRQRSSIS